MNPKIFHNIINGNLIGTPLMIKAPIYIGNTKSYTFYNKPSVKNMLPTEKVFSINEIVVILEIHDASGLLPDVDEELYEIKILGTQNNNIETFILSKDEISDVFDKIS